MTMPGGSTRRRIITRPIMSAPGPPAILARSGVPITVLTPAPTTAATAVTGTT
jgi:hypothetical protein